MKKFTFKIATSSSDDSVFSKNINGSLSINKEYLSLNIVREIQEHCTPLHRVTLDYLNAIKYLNESQLKTFSNYFIKVSTQLSNKLKSVYGRKYHKCGGRVYGNYTATKKSDINRWDDYIILDINLFIDEFNIPVVYIGQATIMNFPLGGKECDCLIGDYTGYMNYLPNYDTFNKVQILLYPNYQPKTIIKVKEKKEMNDDENSDYISYVHKDYDMIDNYVDDTENNSHSRESNIKPALAINSTDVISTLFGIANKVNELIEHDNCIISYKETTITKKLVISITHVTKTLIKVTTDGKTLLHIELNNNTTKLIHEFKNSFYIQQNKVKLNF